MTDFQLWKDFYSPVSRGTYFFGGDFAIIVNFYTCIICIYIAKLALRPQFHFVDICACPCFHYTFLINDSSLYHTWRKLTNQKTHNFIVRKFSTSYITVKDLDIQCHVSWSVLCSMIWGERWLFVLLILVELLTITVLTFFCFVDIGEIVDRHCFNFLLFCWYWWNCWPSLFKLSFHIYMNWLKLTPKKNLYIATKIYFYL